MLSLLYFPTPAYDFNKNIFFLSQQLPSNDMPLANHGGQNNLFPMRGLQHASSQNFNSIYSNIIQNQTTQNTPNAANLGDQWYYEDPKVSILMFYEILMSYGQTRKPRKLVILNIFFFFFLLI